MVALVDAVEPRSHIVDLCRIKCNAACSVSIPEISVSPLDASGHRTKCRFYSDRWESALCFGREGWLERLRVLGMCVRDCSLPLLAGRRMCLRLHVCF